MLGDITKLFLPSFLQSAVAFLGKPRRLRWYSSWFAASAAGRFAGRS
jgi:hypothetical protein